MNISQLIQYWLSDNIIRENIAGKRVSHSRSAKFCSFPDDLQHELRNTLYHYGITKLYLHQMSIWESVKRNENVVITTGTASGKSLGYNLPVINQLLIDSEKRALYLFPTKALAQDQLQSTQEFLATINQRPGKNIRSAVYDGDTPKNTRKSIRQNTNLLLTNPDMLHIGILPYHTLWDKFFKNLVFIIIDEIHVYRGVFGSHVANVIRRIKRITNFYHTYPIFLMTSATIANAKEHAEKLIENDVTLIDKDTSGRGKQTFIIYNPPIINQELGIRQSAIHETVKLANDLIQNNTQTLVFGRTRRTVELLLSYIRKTASNNEVLNTKVIRGYRSGYLPVLRREIERQLKTGKAIAVVGTNALELGINITGLGAVLMMGYPGSIASTIQQSGRAGRGEEESIAVLIAGSDPLDQYLANHIEYIFGQSPEKVLINPDNILLLFAHIRCALYELAFEKKESFGDVKPETVQQYLDLLVEIGEATASITKYIWISEQYPAMQISLRNAGQDNIILVEENYLAKEPDELKTIGVIDKSSALWMAHPGAIYVHEGETFIVNELDLALNLGKIRKITPDYFTQPQRNSTIEIISIAKSNPIKGGKKYRGEIIVTTLVNGYHKIKWQSHERISTEKLELPPSILKTTAYWITINQISIDSLRERNLWRSDPLHYGPDWQETRNIVRERDGYKCQNCSREETFRSHDVHHKIPLRNFSSYIEANSLENLITLCSDCHKKVEKDVFVRSGLSGVSYAMSHLAPLFLMCDKRDIEVHYDIKSTLPNMDPIIFIYELIPAGIGFNQRLYEIHDDLLHETRVMVARCNCKNGCPSCVGPVGQIDLGGKREALALLDIIAP